MQDYLNQIASLNGWQFWISFGVALLICEVLGTDYLMLFLGLAACSVGLVCFLLHLPTAASWIIFCLMTLGIVWYWWRYHRAKSRRGDGSVNDRLGSMVGRTGTISGTPEGENGRIRIDGSIWPIAVPEGTRDGDLIRVVSADGGELKGEKA